MDIVERIRNAAADPEAPWYGSDVVPLMAEAADEIERLRTAAGIQPFLWLVRAFEKAESNEECAHILRLYCKDGAAFIREYASRHGGEEE